MGKSSIFEFRIYFLNLNKEDEEEHNHVKEQEDLQIEILDISHTGVALAE